MSIIHDALKKVQQNMQNQKQQSQQEHVEVLPSANAAADRKKQAGSWIMALVAIIVIGASLMYLFSYIHSNYPHLLAVFNGSKAQTSQAPAAPAPTTKKDSSDIVSSSAESLKQALKPMKIVNPLKYLSLDKEKKPVLKPLAQLTIPAAPDASGNANSSDEITLNVQGIMADAKNNMAIINGGVYQEGATVQGVKIVKIGLDAIVVEHNGQEQTIKVRK